MSLNIDSKVCAVEPFRYQATPQPIGDQGASSNQINEQALEDYLARLKDAICEDVEAIIEAAGTGGSGVTAFIELSDVPHSYAGGTGDLVAVNGTEDGLEFVAFPFIPADFIDLGDVPNSYTGAGGQAVAVNAGETGLEFVAFPTSGITDLAKWINYSFGLVAGTPLQTIGNGGGASSPAATSTVPALATTSISTSIYKVQYVTTNATNQICYVVLNTLLVAIGTAADLGGFRWRALAGPNSAVTNQRSFFGLRASIANPTSVDPSSQTNIIGFGTDAGETTLSVMHNDGAGTATKVGLGANFPVQAGELYEMSLTCVPGSGTVDYAITRINTGDTASGNLSTNLPATTQFLSGALWMATAGTAGVATLWFANQYFAHY